MKKAEFNEFRKQLIEEEFDGMALRFGWMFLQLTNKQCDIIKQDILKHAKTFVAMPNGAVRVDVWTFK